MMDSVSPLESVSTEALCGNLFRIYAYEKRDGKFKWSSSGSRISMHCCGTRNGGITFLLGTLKAREDFSSIDAHQFCS